MTACTCRSCGDPRGTWADGARGDYCARCYARWLDNGCPASGPPPPRRAPGGYGIRAGRLEDYSELRSWGLTRTEASRRLGVSVRTIRRYEAELAGAA